MIDYSALKAVAMVVQTGSFEKAARALNVTPSAVSQRVKHLEERLGAVLIERGSPCAATEKGDWLCRHIEQVGMLERELLAELPGLSGSENTAQRVTLHIATNADSLGTWFLKAISHFSTSSEYLFNIAVDDQDHTAEWLRRGRVVAAVTPVQTGSGLPSDAAWYSPISRHGITRFRRSPLSRWNNPRCYRQGPGSDIQPERQVAGSVGAHRPQNRHSVPDALATLDTGFCRCKPIRYGMGMNPMQLIGDHLQSGKLIELIPDTPLDIPLFWQVNRLAADRLASLTQAVLTTARQELAPISNK